MSTRVKLIQGFADRRSRIRSRAAESSPPRSQRRVRSKLSGKPKFESLVVPATKTDHPEWLPLTNLDRVVNPTFISVLFFYEDVLSDKGDGNTFQNVTASLKDSLAKVLVDFYALAGRLTLKEDGLVDLQCNDAGAIFIESSVQVELSELGGPQPMPMLSGMDKLNKFSSMGPGQLYIPDQVNPKIPVLVVKVTRFSCGSIAVAVNWHHTVADGFSGCHFIRSWSQVATGQALSLLPSNDRHLLRPRLPPDASLVNNGNYRKKLDLIQILDKNDPSAAPSPVVKPFTLTQETVQRLKQEVNSRAEVGSSSDSSTKKQPFTSVETVSAKLWKLMTKARSAGREELSADESRFFMFVDGRKRLGLPRGYFGNVVCSACAESTHAELLRRPDSYAASLISNATKGIDGQYFRSLIDWVEEVGITSSDHIQSTGFDVAATFWVFFPLYEINFGWGEPVLSVRNAPPRKLIDGISMMPSPDGKGNMVALLNLHADRMKNLERDPEFIKIIEPLRTQTHGLDPKLFRESAGTFISNFIADA